jgi:hypothetical protein
MLRIASVLAMLYLAGVLQAAGFGIQWAADADYLYYADGTTLLDGDTSGNTACLIQLLWVGTNGTIDQAYGYGDGTGPTDDRVVDHFYIGAGAALGADGWFSGGLALEGGDVVSGRVYFARTWSAPAADYARGKVPSSLTNRYGNSGTWLFPAIGDPGDNFDVASPTFSTTLTPAAMPQPELTAMTLAAGQVNLEVGSLAADVTNRISRAFSLSAGAAWTPVLEFVPDGSTTNWSEPRSNEWGRVFYRLEVDP